MGVITFFVSMNIHSLFFFLIPCAHSCTSIFFTEISILLIEFSVQCLLRGLLYSQATGGNTFARGLPEYVGEVYRTSYNIWQPLGTSSVGRQNNKDGEGRVYVQQTPDFSRHLMSGCSCQTHWSFTHSIKHIFCLFLDGIKS